jgi:Fe-S cluster assembly protein SufD
MQLFQIQKHQQQDIHLTEGGEYVVELLGEGAHANIQAAFLAQKEARIDIHLTIIHKAGRTSAKTMLKGVALDRSQIRFFGRIKIEKDCPLTTSFLEERILLLSDQAKAEAVPELEILSSDVKCSHAASISRIPAEHIFYLQSRGLSPEVAQQEIVDGFLHLPC